MLEAETSPELLPGAHASHAAGQTGSSHTPHHVPEPTATDNMRCQHLGQIVSKKRRLEV